MQHCLNLGGNLALGASSNVASAKTSLMWRMPSGGISTPVFQTMTRPHPVNLDHTYLRASASIAVRNGSAAFVYSSPLLTTCPTFTNLSHSANTPLPSCHFRSQSIARTSATAVTHLLPRYSVIAAVERYPGLLCSDLLSFNGETNLLPTKRVEGQERSSEHPRA